MSSSKPIILITGANGGLGYETARILATSSSPSYHIIIGSRSVEKGKTALNTIQSQSPQSSLSTVQLDVTSEESLSSAYAQISKEFGKLDVLINNAGIISPAKDLREKLKATFETNAFGAALTTEQFLPLLEKSDDPRILYITSGLGSITKRADPKDPYYYPVDSEYRMSKAALNMFVVCQHKNFKDQGMKVKVWAICPGYLVTDLTGEEGRTRRVKTGALSADVGAQTITEVVKGKRDADVGKFVYKDGIYPW